MELPGRSSDKSTLESVVVLDVAVAAIDGEFDDLETGAGADASGTSFPCRGIWLRFLLFP